MSEISEVLHPVFRRLVATEQQERGIAFSADQLALLNEVFRKTLDQYWKPGRHAIDRRGRIALYFVSYYYVFLLGRDRRESQRKVEQQRRFGAALLGNTFFVMVVLSPIILLLLAVLYLLKMYLGIDLFPNFHLPGAIGIH